MMAIKKRDRETRGMTDLHDRCPEMDCLDADLALPGLLEPTLSGAIRRRALPPLSSVLAELLAEAMRLKGWAGLGAKGSALAEERARGAQHTAR